MDLLFPFEQGKFVHLNKEMEKFVGLSKDTENLSVDKEMLHVNLSVDKKTLHVNLSRQGNGKICSCEQENERILLN